MEFLFTLTHPSSHGNNIEDSAGLSSLSSAMFVALMRSSQIFQLQLVLVLLAHLSITPSYSCYVYPVGVRDPCSDRRCSYGASCKASLDGLTARCQCPDRCNQYGDAIDSVPVCGSDGRHYETECEMRMTACREMKNIERRYDGKCDPCETMTSCLPTEVCQLNETRQAVCRCNDDCDRQMTPVCGTDGRTYRNECHLKLQSCRQRLNIAVLHRGKCPTGASHPCSTVACDATVYEYCRIDARTGSARCTCPMSCERRVRPVCGTDGRVYDDECHLQRQACLTRQRISVHYHGQCDVANPCNDHQCQYGAICYVADDQPLCKCPLDCPDYYDPVCASDGLTYDNECVLRTINCAYEKNVTVVASGTCSHKHSPNGCDSVKCDFYATCDMDRVLGPRCVCLETSCSQETGEVCGSDGITYANECQLRMTSCKNRTLVTVASWSACDLCTNIACRHGAVCRPKSGECQCVDNCPDDAAPVCASDGLTYPNECVMRRASCQQDVTLHVIHHGSCNAKRVTSSRKDVVSCSDNDYGCCSDGKTPATGPDGAGCSNRAKNCSRTEFGCCSDGETPALGPDQAGCPDTCLCNTLGSYGQHCDRLTRQCKCKPGVTGLRCDRCLPNYWGLFNIANGVNGCSPCRCNVFGSERDDCEQMTGRCDCKPNVTGLKCNYCTNGKQLGPYGCSGLLFELLTTNDIST